LAPTVPATAAASDTPTPLPTPAAARVATPSTAPSPTAGLSVTEPLAVACPPTISFEETIPCSLDTAAEMDSYTFEANANDIVVIRVLNTSGSEWLTTSLWDSQNNRLCSYTGFAPTQADLGCTLPADGTFTIQIEKADARQTQPIPYTLYLYRRTNPVNARPVNFDESLSGALDTALEIDTYTFEASADDTVVVKVLNNSGTEWLTHSLWDAQNSRVCSYTGFAPTAADLGCTLPGDGTYIVQVEKANARQTQATPYTLYVHRRNAPTHALPINFDQSLSGSLDTGLEIDAYTFEGQANDTAVVKVLNTASTEWLTTSLWGAQNSRICSYTGFAPNPADRGCTLPGDGTYIIQVEKADARQTQPIPYTIGLYRR
jgi:hypothetical protein